MALAAVAGVGALFSAYGQISQAQAQASAARADAANKQAKATETLSRASFNKTSLQIEMDEKAGNVSSQYAAGNVDVGSGSPLSVHENTLAAGRRKMFMMQNEANWEAQEDMISANAENTLAGQKEQAGYLGAAGSLLGGAANIAMNSSSSKDAPDSIFDDVPGGGVNSLSSDNGGIQYSGSRIG